MIKRNFLIAALGAVTLLAANAPAAVLDLRTTNTGTINGAIFTTDFRQPTGTGVFNPFLSMQNSPMQQGYNSNTGNFDTKREPQWNHEIRLSDLRITNFGGVNYFGFVVDINEPNSPNQSMISLDALRIWTSPTTQYSLLTDANGFFNGPLGQLRYDLGNNSVLYDDRNSGSGQSDIQFYIPVEFFAGAQSTDYVYMYQRWGGADSSQGGFEETAIAQGIVSTPELSSFFPIIGLMVAVLSTQILRRRRAAQLTA
ncbi:MAG: hypothetical protein H0V56_02010 [Chthoniobacterales bacterium]|nr:hypothetical protein [Chthoniobacterales bacterium]